MITKHPQGPETKEKLQESNNDKDTDTHTRTGKTQVTLRMTRVHCHQGPLECWLRT